MSTIIPIDNVLAHNRSGFLLMELLIAFVLLAGLATVVAHYQVNSVYLAQESQKQAEALAILMNVVNEYKIAGTMPPLHTEMNNIHVSWRSIPVQLAVMHHDMPPCRLVEFTAEWQGVTSKKSMELIVSER